MPAGSRGVLAVLALAGCLEAPPTGGAPPTDANPTPRTWVDRTGASNPPPLYAPRLAYDEVNARVLAYGGSTGAASDDATAALMAWDGASWTTLCDPCEPGRRFLHGFAFDSRRGVAVLYGGVDELGVVREDHWEWDGAEWQARPATDSGPGARSSFWMAFDPDRGRLVVFGGEAGGGDSNELFEHDGTTWYSLGQGIGPGPRSDRGASAAWDPIGRRVLLYGGGAGEGLDDLWGWDGTEWTRVCDPCTGQPRHSAMLEVDPARERIVVVGGFSGSSEVSGTWELRPDGSPACAWEQPSGRDTGGIARDAARDVIVLFGGNGGACGGNCDQTLELIFDERGTCRER